MPIVAAHGLDVKSAGTQIYNAMDCMLTFEVFNELDSLPKPGPIYDFSRALQAPVMEMMLRGFRIDPDARDRGIKSLRERLARLSHIIDSIAKAVWDEHPPIPKNLTYPKPTLLNPDSTAQLQRFFYGALNVSPIIKWSKGVETRPMDRETLERIGEYYPTRLIVAAILAYRDAAGQLEVLESQVDPDWRMRTSYNIGGTETGRFSSSKSFTGTGRNLQNVEEDLRYIFVPDPGYKLYGFDLEQSESREVGWLCGVLFGDWSYLNACESGDLHTTIARMVWSDLPWTGDLKKDRKLAEQPFYRHHTRRDATKRLGHGKNYLGKDSTMATHTKIPLKLVSEFSEAYFSAFPCIPQMHHWVARELQTKQHLTNIFGRRRDFFDRTNSDETLREAVAYMFQSATGDRLNLGMWRVWKHMPEAQLLAQLHDAFYYQAPDRGHAYEAENIARTLKFMEVEQFHEGRRFVIPGEAKLGLNWGPRYKADDSGNLLEVNPKGLDKFTP